MLRVHPWPHVREQGVPSAGSVAQSRARRDRESPRVRRRASTARGRGRARARCVKGGAGSPQARVPIQARRSTTAFRQRSAWSRPRRRLPSRHGRHRGLLPPVHNEPRGDTGMPVVKVLPSVTPYLDPLIPSLVGAQQCHLERLGERRLPRPVAADHERQPGAGIDGSMVGGPMPRKPSTSMAVEEDRRGCGGGTGQCLGFRGSPRLAAEDRIDQVGIVEGREDQVLGAGGRPMRGDPSTTRPSSAASGIGNRGCAGDPLQNDLVGRSPVVDEVRGPPAVFLEMNEGADLERVRRHGERRRRPGWLANRGRGSWRGGRHSGVRRWPTARAVAAPGVRCTCWRCTVTPTAIAVRMSTGTLTYQYAIPRASDNRQNHEADTADPTRRVRSLPDRAVRPPGVGREAGPEPSREAVAEIETHAPFWRSRAVPFARHRARPTMCRCQNGRTPRGR